MASRGQWKSPRLSRDADLLRMLPLIPVHILWRMPRDERPGKVTDHQRFAIRQRLNMRQGQRFNRCRGRNKAFIARAEARGDFSHSGKKPPCNFCDECRCKRTAGEGTKGDFYGLGPETGHLGVWLCAKCQLHKTPGLMLKWARYEVQHLQAYGEVAFMGDRDYTEKLVKYETQIAKRSIEINEDMERLAGEFDKVLKEIESDEAFEYVKGERMPLSTAARAGLIIDLAKAKSRLRIDEWKTRRDENLISVDDALSRSSEVLRAFREALVSAVELVRSREVRGEDGESLKDPVDYAMEIIEGKWFAIWKRKGDK